MRKGHRKKKKVASEILELDIVELGYGGDGIARHDGLPVYVPLTLAGDTVKAKVIGRSGSVINAEMTELTRSSPKRVEPACRHFGTCGGCRLQMLSPPDYQKWITDSIKSVLSYHKLDAEKLFDPLIVNRGTRRRLSMKALKVASGVILGFARRRSHDLVDVHECPVAHPDIVALFSPLRQILAEVLPARRQVTLHITLTHTGIDLLIDGMQALVLVDREKLAAFAQNNRLAALHICSDNGIEPIAVIREPVMIFGQTRVSLPAGGFTQASGEGELALTKAVVAAIRSADHVADLFCGIGTFTFPLGQVARIKAYEGSKTAVDALSLAAKRSKDIKEISVFHRDLFRRPLTAFELSEFDAVIFDPPRAGAQNQAAELAQSAVPTVVAVSCNPNSFARDAKILVGGGYRFESLLPVDQFLWSGHLELVGIFKRS